MFPLPLAARPAGFRSGTSAPLGWNGTPRRLVSNNFLAAWAAGLVNSMSENRELTMDDYLAMLRRRLKVILIPALLAPLAGFVVSYVFPPKYTSQSTVLVEGQKVPDNYVQPVITSDFTQRVQTLKQEILSPTRLRPMIESLQLVKPEEEGKLISDIQQNMQVEPVITSMSAAANAGASGGKKKKPSVSQEPVPGFNVNLHRQQRGARAENLQCHDRSDRG